MQEIYLLANAHIDPVWQWGLDEGIGVALATFRSAANLLERNENFVFNHNEAILYRWVKEYEPKLFERIRRLVAEGRWHIMGGFELQPDCVMPSGEAMVRQIQSGRIFFEREFGVCPTVAVSMDCFGHSRGMVQILKKCGYEGYIFLRCHAKTPENFRWIGLDGSEILAHRLAAPYGTPLGGALDRLLEFAKERDGCLNLFPWGVGNHGGGASQQDIDHLNAATTVKLRHSTPEDFYEQLRKHKDEFPTVEQSILPFNIGGYTSLVRIKKANRRLENALVRSEKMASIAEMSGLMEYPRAELNEAWRSLLFLEFHDVLPGTITEPVAERMLERAGHGLEIAKNLASRAFYRLSACESLPKQNEIPILVFNSHPYPVTRIVKCEYNLPDQNWGENDCTMATIRNGNCEIPAQMCKEDSTIPLDWRKRVAFEAELAPLSMNRFEVILHKGTVQKPNQNLELLGDALYARISDKTGLVEEFRYRGKPLTGNRLGEIMVYEDTADPWHMTSDKIGRDPKPLPMLEAPRVLSDGAVFKEVFVKFGIDGAEAEVVYTMPKHGGQLNISIRLNNILRCRMFRMRIPFMEKDAVCIGESMFGQELLFADGTENASQRYDILRGDEVSLGVVNDGIYGGCFREGCLEKTLLRSPVYCAHPVGDRTLIREDAMYSYAGMGQFENQFILMPVERNCEFEIARQAQIENEPPMAVSCFPPEDSDAQPVSVSLEGNVILSAMKRAEDGNGFVLRIYEPVGNAAYFHLKVGEHSLEDRLSPFQAQMYRLNEHGFSTCDFLA